MDVEKAFLLEEIVDRAADAVSHPRNGAEGVGARPQMGDRAQELERVLLLLQRIALGVGPAMYGDTAGLDLGGLAFAGRGLHEPLDVHAATGREALDVRLVIGQRGLGQHLDITETGAVVDLDEAEARLGVAARAHPALEEDFAPDRIATAGLGHTEFLHHVLLSLRLGHKITSANRSSGCA